MHRIGIIGTAGRKDAANKLTPPMFDSMVKVCQQLIDSLKWPASSIVLISGGSAWADHVAVRLHNDACLTDDPYHSLKLYIPCAFHAFRSTQPGCVVCTNSKTQSQDNHHHFVDIGSNNWRTNPGHSLNSYHTAFTTAMGGDRRSFKELATAIASGADVTVVSSSANGSSMHARNTCIANDVDLLISFTFNQTRFDVPESSGTLDTWNKCKAQKVHFSLNKIDEASYVREATKNTKLATHKSRTKHVVGKKRNRDDCDDGHRSTKGSRQPTMDSWLQKPVS